MVGIIDIHTLSSCIEGALTRKALSRSCHPFRQGFLLPGDINQSILMSRAVGTPRNIVARHFLPYDPVTCALKHIHHIVLFGGWEYPIRKRSIWPSFQLIERRNIGYQPSLPAPGDLGLDVGFHQLYIMISWECRFHSCISGWEQRALLPFEYWLSV